jgi:integrase
MRGNLVVRTDSMDRPIYEAKWRHAGRQIKRRLGYAWLEHPGQSAQKSVAGRRATWIEPRGPVPAGLLSRDAALVAMRDVIAAWEAQEAVQNARQSAGITVETFTEAALAWLQRAERRGRKVSTITDYRYAIDTYLVPGPLTSRLGIARAPFATLPLADLDRSPSEAAAIVGSWFESMPPGRTREKLEMIVNSVFKLAVAQGWTDANPMDRVDREPVKYDPALYDWYSTQEVEALIAAASKRRDSLIYAVSAYAGLRCGEVLALRWQDIDFDHRRIRVMGNVSYGKLTTTKGGRGRTVPLVPQLAEHLQGCRQPATSFVFPGNFGADFLDPSTLRRRYATDVKRAGLRHLPMHSLRHHFGSVSVNVASLVQVRDWLGHADLRTTSRYLHSKSHANDADMLGRGFAA